MPPPEGDNGGGGGGGGDGGRTALLVGLFLALGALSLMDVSGLGGAGGGVGGGAEASAQGAAKDVPKPKYASMMAGPTIRFLYW